MGNMLDLIESVSSIRMLMIGEQIEDVYHYVTPLGRPVKELILSTEWRNTEVFQGGITAAATHARSFCAEVSTWSSCSVRKERWVEVSHARKLFQVQHPIEHLKQSIPPGPHDVIALIDYGHNGGSWLGRDLYLALNVQTNSANYGFNLARPNDRADYLVVDELEARLATGNRSGPLLDSLEMLKQNAPKIVITLGRDGAMGWSEPDGLCKSPAYTTRILDTMGAGDCFFAVTAPMSRLGSIPELLSIGNAAGALKAQIIGHREPVTKASLIAYMEAHGTRWQNPQG